VNPQRAIKGRLQKVEGEPRPLSRAKGMRSAMEKQGICTASRREGVLRKGTKAAKDSLRYNRKRGKRYGYERLTDATRTKCEEAGETIEAPNPRARPGQKKDPARAREGQIQKNRQGKDVKVGWIACMKGQQETGPCIRQINRLKKSSSGGESRK